MDLFSFPTVLFVCGGLFVLLVALDLLLGRVKFRKTDERLEKHLGKFRYKGW